VGPIAVACLTVIHAVQYLMVALFTVFWGGVICLMVPFDRGGELALRSARIWVRWVLKTYRVRVEAEGLENISPTPPYVVMANHQSLFDIAAIAHTLPSSWRFVAKRELARVPFFGWGMVAAGHIVVDRQDNEASVRSLKRAAQRIREGITVIIFPEGTRSPTGELRRFKSGGFHLAAEAEVPILPATVSGSRRVTPRGSLHAEPGRILVRYGEPIPTAGLDRTHLEPLKERVFAAIRAGFDRDLQS
jgi:1-acyl-sn-glycerol-3-phosphate acyltransferase